ncbi:YbhB/YbcL family Raf kinase inhibitor-like protein [Candidatus Gracilibacteria bacterium]|nr:YbhB/YbcL family Raf kinase inhibitor-like protein [Candidatus Gracilibacteria bacterium]
MQITSASFENNGILPTKYTCEGKNINPPLEISGTPENTKSLVLICDDPDAVSGIFTHWTVWNISPKTTEIKENSIPLNAIQGTTSFGKTGYGSPCPPKNTGKHRYTFKIYAIDKTLDIPASTTAETLYKTIENSIIDKAETIGIYSR